MFTLEDAAIAYAISAERMCENQAELLNTHPALVPIFVSHLFQSLEISIKFAGIESGLFTSSEARSKANGNGHGINELASLAIERIGAETCEPLLMALRFGTPSGSGGCIREMIEGPRLQRSRKAYCTRRLGYAEVSEGDFALIRPIQSWVEDVKQTATNLKSAVDILSQWKTSSSKSKHFAIWLQDNPS